MLAEWQAEVKAATVDDTPANEEAYHFSMFWLKSQHKSSLKHKATQVTYRAKWYSRHC